MVARRLPKKPKQAKPSADRRPPEVLWAERPKTTPAKPRPTAGKLGRPLLPRDAIKASQVKVRLTHADMRALEAFAKEEGVGLATGARKLIRAGLLAAAKLKLRRASREGREGRTDPGSSGPTRRRSAPRQQ